MATEYGIPASCAEGDSDSMAVGLHIDTVENVRGVADKNSFTILTGNLCCTPMTNRLVQPPRKGDRPVALTMNNIDPSPTAKDYS